MHSSKSKIFFLLPAVIFVLIVTVSIATGPDVQAQVPAQQDIIAANQLMKDGDSLSEKDDEKSLLDAEQKYLLALDIYRKLTDSRGEAWSLFSLGRTYKQLRKNKEAIEHYELSLRILKARNDYSNAAKSESNIASILRLIGQPDKARERYLAALEMCTKAGELVHCAFILNSLGELEVELGRVAEAIDYFGRAKTTFAQGNDNAGAYISTLKIADAQQKLKRFDAARSSLAEALGLVKILKSKPDEFAVQRKLCELDIDSNNPKRAVKCIQTLLGPVRESKEVDGELRLLESLARAYSQDQDFLNAISILQQVILVAKKQSNLISEAFAYYNLGFSFFSLGKHLDAIEAYDNSLRAFDEANLREFKIPSLQLKGFAYQKMGQRKNAFEFFDQALKLSIELKKQEDECNALENLGMLFYEMDDYARSLQYLEQAVDLTRKLKKKEKLGLLLTRIGEALFGTKQYDKILPKYVEALATAKEVGDRSMEASALERLGAFYTAVGEFDEARQYYEQSLKIAVYIKDQSAENDAILGIAEVQYKTGKFDQALQNYEKVISLSKKAKDAYLESTALIGLGISVRSLSQPEKALGYLTRALDIASKADEKYRVAQAINEIGNTYLELQKFEKALEYSELSLSASRLLSDEERVALSLRSVMKAHFKLNRPGLAAFYGKLLINILQDARIKLKTYGIGIQRSFLKDKESFYRDLSDVLIGQGRIAEAERVLAMLKEEEYFDYLRRDGDVVDELTSKLSLTQEEQKAFDEYKKHADIITSLAKELGELQIESRQYEVGKFPKQARLNELEKQVANANVVFTAFLDSLKLSLGTKDVRVNTLESGSQAILKELREPRTVFISTIVGEEKLNIVVTTADTQKAYSVKTKEVDVNRLVADFRSALRSPRIDPRLPGKALFDILFPDGVLKDLQGVNADTIVWSLDGTLRYVPISALWDGEEYLVERFNNVVITLASRDKIAAKSGDRSKWVALGVGVSKEATVKEADGTLRTFEALTAVPEELCSVISDPADKTRCAAISSGAKGVINGRTMLDDEFTLPSFKSSLGRFPVVHIASHFSLNAGNESDSYLLLGGGEDRRLSLAAIRQSGTQFVGVDLLTLSACNTGIGAGSKSNGVEIEGFGALAQRSGARSVLASLWAVSDASTRNLMIEFYRQLEANPSIRKVEALRRAQISLLNGNYKPAERPTTKNDTGTTGAVPGKSFAKDSNAPFAHPYYWSPFILIGNWQ